jgi:hypothetical protein
VPMSAGRVPEGGVRGDGDDASKLVEGSV